MAQRRARISATPIDEDDREWIAESMGEDLRGTLVEEHLWLVDRLVGQTARRFPNHVERNELWSAGVLGLVEAARRYDASLNVPFPAYAAARVRGEMLEAARGADLASRRLRRSLRDLAAVVEQLTQELGRVPNIEEVAERSHLDAGLVRQRLDDAAALARSSSLDADTTGTTTAAALGDPDADPSEILAQQELIGALREAVDALPEPLHSVIVRTHWGNERLVDIAADMGITFQRVAQYRAEAITALTAWFSNLYDAVPTPAQTLPGSVRRAAFCSQLAQRSSWSARLDAAQRHLDG
ncbi:MAG: sigma-70 family RNA polymerase sigma factor [Ilumatobacteraceae bacterium]